MTKIFNTREITKTIQVYQYSVCDWCKKNFFDIQESGGHDYREIIVQYRTGYMFPEGPSLEGWQICDLCDDCAEKLRIKLLELGVTVTTFSD